MPKLKAPEDVTGCSFAGKSYEVKNGHVLVPDEAVADLISHGFKPVAADKKEEAARLAAEKAAAEKEAAEAAAAEAAVKEQAAP